MQYYIEDIRHYTKNKFNIYYDIIQWASGVRSSCRLWHSADYTPVTLFLSLRQNCTFPPNWSLRITVSHIFKFGIFSFEAVEWLLISFICGNSLMSVLITSLPLWGLSSLKCSRAQMTHMILIPYCFFSLKTSSQMKYIYRERERYTHIYTEQIQHHVLSHWQAHVHTSEYDPVWEKFFTTFDRLKIHMKKISLTEHFLFTFLKMLLHV